MENKLKIKKPVHYLKIIEVVERSEDHIDVVAGLSKMRSSAYEKGYTKLQRIVLKLDDEGGIVTYIDEDEYGTWSSWFCIYSYEIIDIFDLKEEDVVYYQMSDRWPEKIEFMLDLE